MWNPKDNLIQVEIGIGLVNAFTERDKRSIINKLSGFAPPETGNLLKINASNLRNKLKQKENIFLPPIAFRENKNINPFEFIMYVGINAWRMNALEPVGLFDFIEDKIKELNNIPSDKNSIVDLINKAFIYVSCEDYQNAFDNYSKAYYHCFLNSYQYELIRCIFDVGTIKLMGCNYFEAQVLFEYALEWLNSPNIADVNLKMHCMLNMSNTYKLRKEYNNALKFYKETYEIAANNNNNIAFLSLLSASEIQYINNNYKNALSGLEKAKLLVLSDNHEKKYEFAFHIQEKITDIYIQIQNELINMETRKSTEQKPLITLFTKLISVVLNSFIESSIKGVIYKLLEVKGLSPTISFVGKIQNVKADFINSKITSDNLIIGIDNTFRTGAN